APSARERHEREHHRNDRREHHRGHHDRPHDEKRHEPAAVARRHARTRTRPRPGESREDEEARADDETEGRITRGDRAGRTTDGHGGRLPRDARGGPRSRPHHHPAGNCRQRRSSTVASAASSTQVMRSSIVASGNEPQVWSGQLSHHVIDCAPGVGPQVRPFGSHTLLSCTDAPLIMVQSSRVATTVHVFPVPVRQQNGGFATGLRLLPHFFLMDALFFASAFWSVTATFAPSTVFGSRHVAFVPPPSPHFSSVFSRDTRYLKPAFPIARWQSFSPVSPRLCCSGRGAEHAIGEQWAVSGSFGSFRSLAQSSAACEAYTIATKRLSSEDFQHSRQSETSVGVPTARASQLASAPVAPGLKLHEAYPATSFGSAQPLAIFSSAFMSVVWIFRFAVASGHGPGVFPTFSLSRHFSCVLRTTFLYLRSDPRIAFWHFAGSACAGDARSATARTRSQRAMPSSFTARSATDER